MTIFEKIFLKTNSIKVYAVFILVLYNGILHYKYTLILDRPINIQYTVIEIHNVNKAKSSFPSNALQLEVTVAPPYFRIHFIEDKFFMYFKLSYHPLMN